MDIISSFQKIQSITKIPITPARNPPIYAVILSGNTEDEAILFRARSQRLFTFHDRLPARRFHSMNSTPLRGKSREKIIPRNRRFLWVYCRKYGNTFWSIIIKSVTQGSKLIGERRVIRALKRWLAHRRIYPLCISLRIP